MPGQCYNRQFRDYCIEFLRDINNIPKSLYGELNRKLYILRDVDGSYVWNRRKPDSLSYQELTALYRRCCLFGLPPMGLHAPENLGKIDPKGVGEGHE